MKTNKEDKNKGCVETLKMFRSLVFNLAMPSKSGGFLVPTPERSHCRYGALGSGLRRRGDKMCNWLPCLAFLFVYVFVFPDRTTLTFPCLNYLIILTPWAVASPQYIVLSGILCWGVSGLREMQLTGNKF